MVNNDRIFCIIKKTALSYYRVYSSCNACSSLTLLLPYKFKFHCTLQVAVSRRRQLLLLHQFCFSREAAQKNGMEMGKGCSYICAVICVQPMRVCAQPIWLLQWLKNILPEQTKLAAKKAKDLICN